MSFHDGFLLFILATISHKMKGMKSFGQPVSWCIVFLILTMHHLLSWGVFFPSVQYGFTPTSTALDGKHFAKPGALSAASSRAQLATLAKFGWQSLCWSLWRSRPDKFSSLEIVF